MCYRFHYVLLKLLVFKLKGWQRSIFNWSRCYATGTVEHMDDPVSLINFLFSISYRHL